MQTSISAREANHNFARILREVASGTEFVVTRRGVPIARIVPARPSGERQLTPEQERILERSMARLRKGWPLGGGRLDRDALHER